MVKDHAKIHQGQQQEKHPLLKVAEKALLLAVLSATNDHQLAASLRKMANERTC
jgi:hypothetical protein